MIAATTSALLGSRRMSPRELAPIIGTSKATVYNKLNNATPFTAAEVALMAAYFGVPIIDFYDGMGGRVGPVSVTSGGARARQGSNLRPSAYKVVDLDDWVARQSRPAPSQVRPAA